MRISDWSSDVCSSDLHRQIAALRRRSAGPQLSLSLEAADARGIAEGDPVEIRTAHGRIQAAARLDNKLPGAVVVGEFGWSQACDDLVRKSVVQGKRVSLRVDLGVIGNSKNKNKYA